MYGNFQSQVFMSHLFEDLTAQRMQTKSQRSKPKSNEQIKGTKTHEKNYE